MDILDIKGFKKVSKEESFKWFRVKDGIHYANESISIVFPTVYINKELCIMQGNARLLCIFAIMNYARKEYGIALAPCMLDFNALKINDVLIQDKEYTEIKYHKDDVVLPNGKTVISDDFIFTVFELFFISGKIPWFLGYEDVAGLLEGCRKFAGSGVGDNPIAPHILCSLVARSPSNIDNYYRESINKREDLVKVGTPTYVGLSNPFLSFESTTSKLIGAYLGDGMKAAVINKSDNMQELDKALIK